MLFLYYFKKFKNKNKPFLLSNIYNSFLFNNFNIAILLFLTQTIVHKEENRSRVSISIITITIIKVNVIVSITIHTFITALIFLY